MVLIVKLKIVKLKLCNQNCRFSLTFNRLHKIQRRYMPEKKTQIQAMARQIAKASGKYR